MRERSRAVSQRIVVFEHTECYCYAVDAIGVPGGSSRLLRSRHSSTTAGGIPSGVPRPNVTIHDLRHTFGVHCAQAGVPIVRLRKLLGHASPHMTMRYMKHAPESYFAEDAAKVAASISGEQNREAQAQAALARESVRQV